jgi:peptidoglycan hydrolase CwlO-like protein
MTVNNFFLFVITAGILKSAQRLEQSGIPRNQAEAFAEAQKDFLDEITQAELATKNDIKDIRNDIQTIRLKMDEQYGQFALLKWMIGFLIAGIQSILNKIGPYSGLGCQSPRKVWDSDAVRMI